MSRLKDLPSFRLTEVQNARRPEFHKEVATEIERRQLEAEAAENARVRCLYHGGDLAGIVVGDLWRLSALDLITREAVLIELQRRQLHCNRPTPWAGPKAK